MITFEKARPQDADRLAEVAKRAFAEDVAKYGFGPPGHDSAEEHRMFMSHAHYYKILEDGQIIGGFCLIQESPSCLELGIIYVDPSLQSKGIGSQAMTFMHEEFPHITHWKLDTGFEAYRNHHFYQKAGYTIVGKTEPDATGYHKIVFEKLLTGQ
ncbi:GNAT family N-acetyltransferase [Tumebacillus avium]|uniref:GNAT family N-acetyltransferase n=1 Tax=Tumebacillus avium TaxID=1903704 RepID=A0A1Y0IQE6_9BACL|nr:GNAT family N-acetyltransferase [Tumebacillus avium]ARU62657.1 GNAT family N-acetyltransferase [Tumebacillus avium]